MKVHKQTAEWKTLGQKEFRTRCVHEHIKNTARCALRTPSAGSTRERTVELWKVYARRRLAVTISDRNSWSLGDTHSFSKFLRGVLFGRVLSVCHRFISFGMN